MITRKHFVLILWTEGAVFHLFDLLLDFPLLLNYLVLLLFELALEVQSVMNGVGLPLVLYLVLNGFQVLLGSRNLFAVVSCGLSSMGILRLLDRYIIINSVILHKQIMIELHRRQLRLQVNYLINKQFIKRRTDILKHVASLQDLEMVEFLADLLDGFMFDIQFIGVCLNFKEEYLPCNLLIEVPQNQLLISYHLPIFVVVLEGLKVILDLHVHLVQSKDFLLLDAGIFLFVKDILSNIVCRNILDIDVANLTILCVFLLVVKNVNKRILVAIIRYLIVIMNPTWRSL